MDDDRRKQAREGLRDGPERAGARAHFRAMGIDPARLGGPIVGIASTWTGTMPCNIKQRELSDRAAKAIEAAGGVPLPFNTIAVSDNQSQGTPGMRASLISREVIADSIELMVHAHDFDALLCLVGCDKTVPAALMALARVDKPAVVLYSGPMRAGRWRGADVTIQHVWEVLGAFERGAASREELDALERHACPGPGTCAGHFTANSMAVALDCLGIAPIGDGLIPADATDEKAAAAERGGRLAVSLAADGPTARTFLDRRALLNAMAGIAATRGSSNAMLHLLAIAYEAGIPLTLDELTAVAAHTPAIASLAPVRALGRRGPPPRGRHRRDHRRADPSRSPGRPGACRGRRHARRGNGGCPSRRTARSSFPRSVPGSRTAGYSRFAATSPPRAVS